MNMPHAGYTNIRPHKEILAMSKIKDFINNKDPLTKDIVKELISYKEEDDCLDYKQTIELGSEKEWLGLTKDVSAFANTYGGYLVFGIEDGSGKIVGLARDVADFIKDASKFQAKINRHLDPDIIGLRAKEFRFGGLVIVGVFIPQSIGTTHIISKLGKFKHTSGQDKIILQQGTLYVRRSAGNHLGDSRDLNDVIERRIDQFRSALIDKVARVVNSPASSDVFILSKDPNDKAGERFIIEDSPDAIPVKGMSFSVPPDGPEEEIAAWSVLYRGNSSLRPPSTEVWKWYEQRTKLQLKKNYRLTLFKFSLWNNVPAFYWIQGLKAREIKEVILEAIRGRPTGVEAKQMLIVSAFLGKAFYKTAIKAFGDYIDKINLRMKTFPNQGPRQEFGSQHKLAKQPYAQFKIEKLKDLNEIADKAVGQNRELAITARWKAQNLDCYLYAQDDLYK